MVFLVSLGLSIFIKWTEGDLPSTSFQQYFSHIKGLGDHDERLYVKESYLRMDLCTFSKVFQKYGDNGSLIMKTCVQ